MFARISTVGLAADGRGSGKFEYFILDLTKNMVWDVVFDELDFHVYTNRAYEEEQAEHGTEVVALRLAFDEAAGGGRWSARGIWSTS